MGFERKKESTVKKILIVCPRIQLLDELLFQANKYFSGYEIISATTEVEIAKKIKDATTVIVADVKNRRPMKINNPNSILAASCKVLENKDIESFFKRAHSAYNQA